MAAFYLDENLAIEIASHLRAAGHFVTSTFDEKRTSAPDPLILLEGAERSWTVVTHNRRDFRLLHDAWLRWANAWRVTQPHAGVLVLD